MRARIRSISFSAASNVCWTDSPPPSARLPANLAPNACSTTGGASGEEEEEVEEEEEKEEEEKEGGSG